MHHVVQKQSGELQAAAEASSERAREAEQLAEQQRQAADAAAEQQQVRHDPNLSPTLCLLPLDGSLPCAVCFLLSQLWCV